MADDADHCRDTKDHQQEVVTIGLGVDDGVVAYPVGLLEKVFKPMAPVIPTSTSMTKKTMKV